MPDTLELGLDVKYSVTSNLTLDVTLNTDFAQVEADDQQVNLTRLSLFFPEKRQFFQERASVFDFATGSVDRLFYSRRIGLNDGEPVRILGGVRMIDISRAPIKDMCSVLGIGVAVSVSTSTRRLSCFNRSLCRTPNRCSSSTTNSPRS